MNFVKKFFNCCQKKKDEQKQKEIPLVHSFKFQLIKVAIKNGDNQDIISFKISKFLTFFYRLNNLSQSQRNGADFNSNLFSVNNCESTIQSQNISLNLAEIHEDKLVESIYSTIIRALPKQRITRERHFIKKYTSHLKDQNQQKFVIQKDWATKYSLYLKNQSQAPPLEINNTQLIDLMKQKQKKLEENYDFVVVPTIIWNILFKLYSGGPELPYSQIKHFNETFYDILVGSSLQPVGLKSENKKNFSQNPIMQALLSIEEFNNYFVNLRNKFKKYPNRYKISSLLTSLIIVMKNAKLSNLLQFLQFHLKDQAVSSNKLTALLSSQINHLETLDALKFLQNFLQLLIKEEHQEDLGSIPVIYEEPEKANYSNASQFIESLFYGFFYFFINFQIPFKAKLLMIIVAKFAIINELLVKNSLNQIFHQNFKILKNKQ